MGGFWRTSIISSQHKQQHSRCSSLRSYLPFLPLAHHLSRSFLRPQLQHWWSLHCNCFQGEIFIRTQEIHWIFKLSQGLKTNLHAAACTTPHCLIMAKESKGKKGVQSILPSIRYSLWKNGPDSVYIKWLLEWVRNTEPYLKLHLPECYSRYWACDNFQFCPSTKWKDSLRFH